MAQIPILSGFLAKTGDLGESYPINMEPVVAETGISNTYLRSPMGAVQFATGPGRDRGAINWNGVHYRVMGSKLCQIGTSVTEIGDVGDDGLPVRFDYSFDALSVSSAGNLFYWNGALTRVNDPDLGTVIDHIYIAGYFMVTDGTTIAVTDLNDPLAVDPLRYGSSETDPDPILGLLKYGNEAYALNRHTIDVFQNVGGAGFPFARLNGASIPKGCCGTMAKALFGDSFAFVGSGRGEALGVYQAGQGQAIKLSSKAIDKALADEPDPHLIRLETMVQDDEQRLFIRLSNQTLVFCAGASLNVKKPVWYIRRAGLLMDLADNVTGRVLIGQKWYCGHSDTGAVATLQDDANDFGAAKGYQFDTVYLYNGGLGAIIRSLELIGKPGDAAFGDDPRVQFSRSNDGVTFGTETSISTGKFGETGKRVQIRPAWRIGKHCVTRVRGAGQAVWAAIEADVEPLNV